jgi:DNA-binding NtrC family response regulator
MKLGLVTIDYYRCHFTEAPARHKLRFMKLNALLVSQDRPSLRVLEALLDVLQIEHQTCQSASEAVELMVHGHRSALMMDFDLPGAGQVAQMARMASAQRRPVVFAMVSAFTPVGGAFQSGVNFVLYKPLASNR